MSAALKLRSYWREESGATAIEYGLIVMMLCIAIVGIFAMGGGVDELFAKVAAITAALED